MPNTAAHPDLSGAELRNPATGELIERFNYLQPRELEAALDAARLGFEAGREQPATERAAVLGGGAGGRCWAASPPCCATALNRSPPPSPPRWASR